MLFFMFYSSACHNKQVSIILFVLCVTSIQHSKYLALLSKFLEAQVKLENCPQYAY